MFADDHDVALPPAVAWHEGELRLLDQTRLPHAEVYVRCKDIETVYEAIANLRVRGAPAIGIAAAYGLRLPFRTPMFPTSQDYRTSRFRSKSQNYRTSRFRSRN